MTDARVISVGNPPAFRQQIARSLGVDPETVGWVAGVPAAEELVDKGVERPDVMALSPAVKDADAFGLASFLAHSSPATAIVLVRDHAQNGVIPAAMRAGIRDVVDLSKGGAELEEALGRAISWSENLRNMAAGPSMKRQGNGRIVSVFSSKGGTGKTFLTSNLSAAFANISGEDTACIDLDLDLGDVFSYYGSQPNAPINDLIMGVDTLTDEALVAAGSDFGAHLYGYGAPTDVLSEDTVPGERIGKLLRKFRGRFAYNVVDATADYSDTALAAFDLSDRICLITGLDIVGIKHLSKALETLLAIGVPRDKFRLVLNRADSKVGLDLADVEKVLHFEIYATIPSSRLVPVSLNKGRPVYIDEPKSPVARSIESIAQKLIAEFQGTGAANVAQQPASKKRRFGIL